MNYRHIYHAGNFADVMKHVAWLLALTRLKEKDKPFAALDAFAGSGLYDLLDSRAQRSREADMGIGRIHAWLEKSARADLPEGLALYGAALRAVNTGPDLRFYPGSPLITADSLRTGDALIANEKHPEEAALLARHLPRMDAARMTHEDGYVFLRAQLPPALRRGLVLVDPPYERRDEFAALCAQMTEWKKRWETGVFIIWFPIKRDLPWNDLYDTAVDTGWNDISEIAVHRDVAPESGLEGSGLLVLNTPWQLDTKIMESLNALTSGPWAGLFSATIRQARLT